MRLNFQVFLVFFLRSIFRSKFHDPQNHRYNERIGKIIIQKCRKETPSDPKYKDTPTFKEFTDFILNEKMTKMDVHWQPIYNICMPCHINYDIIGR